MSGIDVDALGRDDSWEGVRALVTGFGVSGFAAADTLTHLGASVIAVDSSEGDAARREQATLLRILGADVRLGPGATDTLPDGIDIVVTSPGWRPDTPLLAEAAERDIPIWGEVELAWRLRGPDAAPWLVVTGTNGKTTTVQMLEQILLAGGLRARAVGNVGTPVLEAVMDPEGYDVLAVELSSFQLHWTSSMSAEAAAVLNIAPDHYDWHGGADAYAAAKGRVYENVQRACIYNVADPVTRRLVEEADVIEGARAIGFTRGVPGLSELGVVDDLLADRAFVENRAEQAAELGSLDDLYADAPHVIENALAAAALARAHGVEPAAVRAGLRAFRPGPHRVAEVGRIGGIRYVDDSKATNPHAAGAALSAVESAVWIAGGLAKGATFDGVVEGARDRLRAVVLIGRDRSLIAEALARHAPEVPVVEVETGEDDLMDRVVEVASSFAVDGDTVLLAPACASMDQFTDYAQRGELFAEAVRRLAERT
ncbi:UDP-N-acetylmuramoyl-L-alanine--D-glutamate ligase [Aeromicrobium piscarium]|uniref:UDP-N-acetylmuramoyl-L-alanine--D-glutamate ligase n=1 Tax=Aeromicrobium piscarium TaxID=2590901 RepID=UPI001FED0395|nr:UDP-N-acetylmuramoyl-L-alanine--D-glutamate ligase [Aeromicrobium piscarium]